MADESEQQFGAAGVEQAQGFFPMPEAPPEKSQEVEATEALETWSKNREAEAKPIIDRNYQHIDGDNAGKPYDPHGTVPIDRAAQDLTDIRAAEKALTESVENELLANEIDLARRHGEGQSVRAQVDAQPAEQQPQQTEQTQHSDGLDGVDPEVAAAFRNPKILNVLSQHYSAAEAQVAAAQTQAEAQTSAAIQQAADWSRQNAEFAAAAILSRPELQGIAPGQLPGALQALAKANPQAAEQIRQQLGQVQMLTQQAQEAQRVQQQRQAIQFQQAAAAHDAEFDRLSAASGETPEQRDAVARYAHKMLKDSGLTDEFISHHWNNNPLMRSVQGQQILHDAAAFRMLRAGIPNKIAPTPVPRVNRPGSSMDRPDANGRADFAIENKYSGNLINPTGGRVGDKPPRTQQIGEFEMADYDDNPIVEKLKQYPQYFNDPENAWSNFKNDFIKKGPEQRVTDLFTVDAWLEPQSRVSHEFASLFNAKRELSDLNQALLRVGR